MSPFLLIRNILSLVVTAWCGSQFGPWLFLAGLIRTDDILFWSSAIFYIYFPASGLLLGICVFGIVLTSESKDGQLTLKGSESWLKMLNVWSYQNQAVAAACLIVLLYSMIQFVVLMRHALHNAN